MPTQVVTPCRPGAAGIAVLPLLAWLSPGFPVGAYAYSHGLEWAVETGDVRDEASALAWISDILSHGAGRNDMILLVCTARAVLAGDATMLAEINELALALAPSRELLLETSQQGRSFFEAVRVAWPASQLETAGNTLAGDIAYPVAVGLAVAAHAVPIETASAAYLLAFAQNLVSATIRLGAIGQTGAARIIANLYPVVVSLAATLQVCDLDDLGSATFRADVGSFLHETQYTRLFRS